MAGSLSISPSLASSADTGDFLNTPEFAADFGDKNAAQGNNNSMFTGLIRDATIALAVALTTKYLWKVLNK